MDGLRDNNTEVGTMAFNEFGPDSIEAKDLVSAAASDDEFERACPKGPTVHRSAEGIYLTDNHGKQYLEGMAGLWCTAIGYGNEELSRVAAEQMKKLSYCNFCG